VTTGSRRLAAVALFGIAVAVTATLWFLSQAMSVDEEWAGLGDILLNPYIMLPYLVVTLACVAGATVLARRRS